MALTPDNITDLSQYQTIVQYLVAILDKESTICSDQRQVSSENITDMNTTIGNALDAINLIIAPPIP